MSREAPRASRYLNVYVLLARVLDEEDLFPLGRVCVVNVFGGEGLRANPQNGIGACLLGFSGMFPSRVDHHPEHQQAGADPVVPGQVDGQQGAQTFPKRPEHRDRTDAFGLGTVRPRGAQGFLLRVPGDLGFARLRFVAFHPVFSSPRPSRIC
ncbi:hypothetical protein EYF80_008397 [Liparis tanakae]|uniref:Uncharacterized protein n=1 Tax=Liparis tanakae TaxID=230148 RepID=A0A4Z2IU48_9TELE|nr:hypothetical protein EYF80_008397 [Liparis tanakae]